MKALSLVAVIGMVAVIGCGESTSSEQLNRDIQVANVGDRVTLNVPAMT